MVLERPLGTQSLLSAIEWGLASRRRQYQIRDQVAQLHEQTTMLSAAAEQVRHSESRLRAITESMPQIVWSARADGYHDYFNRRFLDFTGLEFSPDSRPPKLSLLHPDDREIARAAWDRARATGTDYQVEYRMRHRSGTYRWQLAQAVPVRDGDQVIRWFGTCTDVDDQVRAREAMAEFNERLEHDVTERTEALKQAMTEREVVEAALRQSQKMEAIGQLTGGIAHDFNNFLTGVIGSLDIVKRRMANGRTDDIGRFMDVASSSAQRAASLTHRLLAFSRQQTLQARPLDINALVESMDALVMGSVHEGIVVERILSAGLPHAVADENQVESALLNLVINARDAMPDGGRLTIATNLVDVTRGDEENDRRSGLQGGSYVELVITDTGVGMSRDVLARSTEPFFTTKPIGKGTGLGLSTIYGFARQSNGHLLIDSVEGAGTTIRLRLPAATEVDRSPVGDRERRTRARHRRTHPGGRGRSGGPLLVVDVLVELGYQAVEADEAHAALDLLRTPQRFDLMISDVGLPGMNDDSLPILRGRSGLVCACCS